MTGFGDWNAQLEQATAATMDLARLLSRYFMALRNEGFTREEALSLTNTLSHDLVGAGVADQ